MRTFTKMACVGFLMMGCSGAGNSDATDSTMADQLAPADSDMAVDMGDGTNAVTRAVGVGDRAPFYDAGRRLVVRVNTHVALTLDLLRLIAAHKPTSEDGDTRVWQWTPALGRNNFRLTATTQADGSITYTLAGRPDSSTSDADFAALITGTAAHSTGDRSGMFDVSYDHLLALHLADHGGDVKVTYDLNVSGQRTITADFTNVNDNADLATASYAFTHNAGGGGTLKFDADGSNFDARPAGRSVKVNAAWIAGGAGRAEIDLQSPTASLDLTECWDALKDLVYATDGTLTIGNASACAL
jgi:hypothetical protein